MATKIKPGYIDDNAVGTAQIADNSITAAKIAAGVLTDQIAGISSSADATAITIDSSENVGIGTSSPSRLLTLSGTASPYIALASNTTGGSPALFFGDSEDDNEGRITYSNSQDYMSFSTATEERMRIDSSGNVQITSSDDTRFDVVDSGDSSTFRIRGDGANTSIGNTTNHPVAFITNNVERMRIDSSGRVGINRTPAIANAKLEVGGADNVPLINVEASGNTAGIGIGGSQLKLYYSNSHIGGFSMGNTNKYNGGSSPGLGGSGGNLRLEGDDSQIIMANNFIHSDNSGNTKFTIRAAYGAVSSAAELALDGGFVTMNVGSSFTEMVHANTTRVQVGRSSATGYYLKVLTSSGYGEQGAQNGSYYHHSTDRGIFYWGRRCEANGGFHTYSDENLKKEITTIDGALDLVAKMNGVTFKWKDPENRGGGDAGKQFGVIAQNMLEVDSELPSLNDDPLETQENLDDDTKDTEYYTMDYSRLTPYFIEAIKELKAKNEALEARIKDLEG